MTADTFTFTQSDGFETHVYHWPAEPQPARGVVQIVHGLAEHAARYDDTAKALNDAGLDVYAHDNRGHGQSMTSEDDKGFFGADNGWPNVVGDVHRLNRHVATQHEGLPIIVLGHSGGSFILQQLMSEHPDDMVGAALSGSDGPVGLLGRVGRGLARFERMRLGKRGRSKLINKISFGAFNDAFKPTRTEFDWLSRNPDVVDTYIADPLCGFICTTQLWFDLLGGLNHLHDRPRLERIPKDLPIYIFSGSEDPVSKGTKGLKKLLDLYAGVGLERVSHRFYEGGRHEMLNETNREEVWSDLIAWIDEVLEA